MEDTKLTVSKETRPANSASHRDDLPRLNRISGQIDGVKKMIDEGRYCPDILTQLRAIRSAVKSIEANILERHLNHCVADAIKSHDAQDVQNRIDELKNLFR